MTEVFDVYSREQVDTLLADVAAGGGTGGGTGGGSGGGSSVAGVYNVTDFGALGDGATNDTAAIQAAINAAAPSGGSVFIPAGTYLTNTLSVPSKVAIRGASISGTKLMLRAGQNSAIFESQGFSTLVGSNTVNAPYGFTISTMTLDGNATNNTTSSRCIQLYAYAYYLDNLWMTNARTEELFSEWANDFLNPSTGSSMEADISNIRCYAGQGAGIRFRGPHDTRFTNVEVLEHHNGSSAHGIVLEDAPGFGGSGVGGLFANCHVYDCQGFAWYITSAAQWLVNCLGEVSRGGQAYIGANRITIDGGAFFGYWGDSTQIGFEFASGVSQIRINTQSWDCASGFIKWPTGGLADGKDIDITLQGEQISGNSTLEVGGPRPARAKINYQLRNLTYESTRENLLSGRQFLKFGPASDEYHFIAKLPASSSGSWDRLVVELDGGGPLQTHSADSQLRRDRIICGNRNGFDYIYTREGDWASATASQVRVVAYSQGDGSVNVYLRFLSGQFTQSIVRTRGIGIVDAASAGGYNTSTPIDPGPASTTVPTGTVVFDSATTPPNAGLQVGELKINYGHLISGGSAPAIAAGAGAGTSPSISVAGTDLAGLITLTEGSAPPAVAGQTIFTVTFSIPFGTAPRVILTPAGPLAATLSGNTQVYVDSSSVTTALFVVKNGGAAGAALTAGAAYRWYYHVIQ